MARSFTSWSALEKAIQQEMKSAMEESVRKGYLKACENAVDFYTEGSPRIYQRTGKYGDAPDTDGVEGSGNNLSAKIYMNPSGHEYTTGTFSAQEVWEAAENHTAGVLGKAGRWEQTERDIEDTVNESFGKRFRKS